MADKIVSRGMFISAVSHFKYDTRRIGYCLCCGIQNVVILKYCLHNARLHGSFNACNDLTYYNTVVRWTKLGTLQEAPSEMEINRVR